MEFRDVNAQQQLSILENVPQQQLSILENVPQQPQYDLDGVPQQQQLHDHIHHQLPQYCNFCKL